MKYPVTSCGISFQTVSHYFRYQEGLFFESKSHFSSSVFWARALSHIRPVSMIPHELKTWIFFLGAQHILYYPNGVKDWNG